MFKFFIDDSWNKNYIDDFSPEIKKSLPEWSDENKDFLDNNFFVLCWVHLDDKEIKAIDIDINNLKLKFFWTKFVEIKSVYLRHPKNRKKYYKDPYGISDENLNLFGEGIFEILEKYKWKFQIIATVFDKRQYKFRDKIENTPLLKTTQVILERVQYMWKDTIIVFDQMEASLQKQKWDHGKILKIHESNLWMENIFVDSYSHIKDIEFQKSISENMLQIADICAYNVRRQFMQHWKNWIEWWKSCETYPYFDKIRKYFYHKNWKVVWCGLVLIPDFNKVNWDILGK